MYTPLFITSDWMMYVACGTATMPPPAALAASIAFWKATESSVTPSPSAPNAFTL
jgi:hypothetical protein